MEEEREESEFGKGLIICLVKFAEHSAKLRNDLELYEKMHKKSPELFDESYAVEMWANGATDHLYEIEVPEGEDWSEIRNKVEELKRVGLDMGHNSFGEGKYTQKDAYKLQTLTREIALLIDKKLGLKPEEGQW